MSSEVQSVGGDIHVSVRNPRQQTATERPLATTVLFTDLDGTLEALRCATAFSSKLNAFIRLIGLEIVPCPLWASEPPRSPAFAWGLLEELAASAKAPASKEVYVCRDKKQALRQLVAVPSILVLGGAGRCWGGREHRLARWLKSQGHSVVFIPTKRANSGFRDAVPCPIL